jgi:formylglycine-generating enzyme required for sulfatase activity/tRNA A-37 threonylcarbamoyl transferase component Bud32
MLKVRSPDATETDAGEGRVASEDRSLRAAGSWPCAEGEPHRGKTLPDDLPAIDPANYVFGAEYARGGLGHIVQARDRRMDRVVALKQLIDTHSHTQAARLVREAFITARLQHPAILPIYEAGRWPTGEPFYAMKLVRGRSLEQEIALRPSLEERLSLLPSVIAVAEAVAYAHSEGVIHRDLKPSNVLIGPFGETAVIDWGLAKDLNLPNGVADERGTESAYDIVTTGITLAGAVLGTPAYMPPEQARGEEVDARADVYAVGAILYTLLEGKPPFPRGNAAEVLAAVLREGPPRIAHQTPGVPRDLAGIVDKAMAREASARYPDAGALLEDLRRFQTGQLVSARAYTSWALVLRWARRHRVVFALAASVLAAAGAVTAKFYRDRHVLIAAHTREARSLFDTARAEARDALASRKRAFDFFDAGDRDQGEAVWSLVLRAEARIERSLARTVQELDMALLLDPQRQEVQALLAEVWAERAALAHADRNASAFDEAVQRLSMHDVSGAHSKRWTAPSTLHLDSDPPGARVRAARYRSEESGRRVLESGFEVGTTPVDDVRLHAGSYLLTFEVEGRPVVRYPIEFEPNQVDTITVIVPTAAAIPKGMVYVPAGRFFYGRGGDEGLRRSFLSSVPLHEVRIGGYFIARTETTFQEWLTYLRALPAAERKGQTPRGATLYAGEISLDEQPGDKYVFSLRSGDHAYRAMEGEAIVYAKRDRRRTQDWLKFPVLGVTANQAEAHVRWLAVTGRVPRARLCSDYEWERAARGGDDRKFPHGDTMEVDDANFDETYGKEPLATGPDEVSSHPASRSPFGIDDMAGNGYEWARSSPDGKQHVFRGGGFRYSRIETELVNRNIGDPTYSDATITLRVCADP